MLTGPKGAVFGSTSYWFLKLCSSLYYYRLQYLYLGDAAIFPKVDGDYFIFASGPASWPAAALLPGDLWDTILGKATATELSQIWTQKYYIFDIYDDFRVVNLLNSNHPWLKEW